LRKWESFATYDLGIGVKRVVATLQNAPDERALTVQSHFACEKDRYVGLAHCARRRVVFMSEL